MFAGETQLLSGILTTYHHYILDIFHKLVGLYTGFNWFNIAFQFLPHKAANIFSRLPVESVLHIGLSYFSQKKVTYKKQIGLYIIYLPTYLPTYLSIYLF